MQNTGLMLQRGRSRPPFPRRPGCPRASSRQRGGHWERERDHWAGRERRKHLGLNSREDEGIWGGCSAGGCTRSCSAKGPSSPQARPRHAAAGAAPAGWREATPEPPSWALLSRSKGRADREASWSCNVRAGRRFLSDGPVMMDCNVHRFQLLRPVL